MNYGTRFGPTVLWALFEGLIAFAVSMTTVAPDAVAQGSTACASVPPPLSVEPPGADGKYRGPFFESHRHRGEGFVGDHSEAHAAQRKGEAVAGGETTLPLRTNGHIARFLEQLFPSADTRDFVGTLSVLADVGTIQGTAIEIGSRLGEFTTLPVAPLR